MFLNRPNNLLEVGFVQSLVGCDFNLEICQPLSVNVYEVKSADWTVSNKACSIRRTFHVPNLMQMN